MKFDVLIVGAGHSGAQAALSLRQLGFEGSIGLLGEEQAPPYERPPLSKDFLAGARTADSLALRPPALWQDRQITLIPGERVIALDPVVSSVETASGRNFGYDKLIWAAGGHARRLGCDGSELGGIHTIRTLGDVDRLRADLVDARQIAIVGGGYIGLEAAAVLRKMGKPVTIVEALPRVLARVAAPILSDFFAAEHRSNGAVIRTDVAVEEIEGNSRVEALRLAGGERVPADVVIVGIGIVPSVRPLLEAGADGGNGVSVDPFCRTTLANVYAVGDCALHASRFAHGAEVRIESVQNASDMATTAARHITGVGQPYLATPWFWSNQYDLKLQTVGLSIGYDEAILRGDPAERSFSVIYRRKGRVIALDCVNRVRDYVQGRALVEAGSTVDVGMLRDVDRPLKSLVDSQSG